MLRLLAAVCALASIGSGAQPKPAGVNARSQVLYQRYCAVCHGLNGDADTPVAQLLQPPPIKFSDPVAMTHVTFDQMYGAIKDGRRGTSMAAWDSILSEVQIGELIGYINSLKQPLPAAMTGPTLSLAVGRRIYARNCAVCHGKQGKPEPAVAAVLQPAPRDFTDPIVMARVDDGRMYTAKKLGISGSAMSGWGDFFGPAEILDLMRYVRSLQAPLAPNMTEAELDIAVGRQIYAQDCAACHGEQGDAATEIAQHLRPPPRDFTNAQIMSSLSDDYLVRIILNGKPGTSMAPWRGVLNQDDVDRVILFIRHSLQKSP